MIFIFLVVVAPGVSDAMFYYESNVLGFTSTEFGILNTIGCCASITGVWFYRALFTKAPLIWYFLAVTLALSFALFGNLLIVSSNGNGLTVAYI